MYINDIWKIKNNIKYGKIKFTINDIVVLLRRKSNGYPKNIKDNTYYIILQIQNDNLFIQEVDFKKSIFLEGSIKINKNFMVPKDILREFKINKVLNEKYN